MEFARTRNVPRSFGALDILMRFHAFPADVQRKYRLVEAVVPAGLGAPPNHHAGETEAVYVLGGEVEFAIDGVVTAAGAGAHVPIPGGAVYAFTAVGDGPARLLILNASAHMHARFFTGMGARLLDDGDAPAPPSGPPDMARILAAAAGAGMTILAAAPQ